MTEATVQLKMTTLDCADPRAAATFWASLLSGDVLAAEDEYAMVALPGGGGTLGFGRVADYEAPGWPNERGSKQFHLDLGCSDIAATQARALELGATLADPQPGETWRVLLDPSGHAFCLTDLANW